MRLGLSGNGASALAISTMRGASCGAVANSYTNVVRALLLVAENEIKCPHGQERERLKRRVGDYGFPHAFFAVDRTTIPLFERPTLDYEAFCNRKSNCSLNALIACNRDRNIINAEVGFPGSVNNNRVLRSSRQIQEERADDYFDGLEHGLGDPAFAVLMHLVPPDKLPAADITGNAFISEYRKLLISLLAKSKSLLLCS